MEWIQCVEGSMYLYSDWETESEKKMKEYRKEWQKKKRANIPIKKRVKQSNKLKETFICECGGSYNMRTSKYNHIKSKRHINYFKDLNFQNNLKTSLTFD